MPGMQWWMAGIIANICIAIVEYLNRKGGFNGFLEALPYTIWFIFIAQWGLYTSWRHAPSMLIAWVWFTAGNNIIRLLSAYWLVGEPPTMRQIACTGGIFLCALAMKGS